MDRDKIRIHPLNAKGKYYVDLDQCTCSAACADVIPNFFAIDTEDFGAYVYKQPANQEEEKQLIEGMNICPVEAICDDGEIYNQ